MKGLSNWEYRMTSSASAWWAGTAVVAASAWGTAPFRVDCPNRNPNPRTAAARTGNFNFAIFRKRLGENFIQGSWHQGSNSRRHVHSTRPGDWPRAESIIRVNFEKSQPVQNKKGPAPEGAGPFDE